MTIKMIDLETRNPGYFRILVDRSPYGEAEIQEALQRIRDINDQVELIFSRAYACLEDDDGPMNSMYGFATNKHKELSSSLFQLDKICPGYSQNSHIKNCLPVRKWEKEVRATERQIRQIESIILEIEAS